MSYGTPILGWIRLPGGAIRLRRVSESGRSLSAEWSRVLGEGSIRLATARKDQGGGKREEDPRVRERRQVENWIEVGREQSQLKAPPPSNVEEEPDGELE